MVSLTNEEVVTLRTTNIFYGRISGESLQQSNDARQFPQYCPLQQAIVHSFLSRLCRCATLNDCSECLEENIDIFVF